ncbi:MAG TPA: hypothetical protein VGR57_11190 [Ktedonobacterales bacterium]|nr:hypothetical protein [Ktedonobacterales bacterium]
MIATISLITAARDDSFTGTLIFGGLALPSIAFAWDGLVRRRILLPAFPVGAALGQSAALVRRAGSLAIGTFSLLGAGFCALAAWGYFLLAFQRRCHSQGSLACLGSLVGSVEGFAWGWFGICVGWFVVVWLWTGDPRKRMLVYGVWYHQERVARQVNQRLQAQELAPLPQEQLYALEEGVLRVLRARGWLDPSPAARADGEPPAARAAPAPEQMRAAVQQEVTPSGGEAERAAAVWLLDDFLAQAQHAAQMSPRRRGWVSRLQLAKLGVYGRRAM